VQWELTGSLQFHHPIPIITHTGIIHFVFMALTSSLLFE